jgi:manganese/zinc/iron transport system substrate-binding protein
MKIYLILLLLAVGLYGCKVQSERDSKTVKIVCSTSIIRDCVQIIVGDSIEVQSLMGPGIDPHGYNPRPSDIALLNNASVVIYNGLHLEGKMVELFEQLGKRKAVLSVASGIDKKDLIITDASAGTVDPHIWFDSEAWFDGLSEVVNDLCDKYPEHAQQFRTNFKNFRTRIRELSDDLRKQLAAIPAERRVLITSHDAFHYFGRSFGIEVKALQGISTTQEPGVRDVVNLVNFIVDRKIKAVFVEHSVSPKAIRTVMESCEKKGHPIRIGGTLYSDALGDAESPGATYSSMLRHNVSVVIKGLI